MIMIDNPLALKNNTHMAMRIPKSFFTPTLPEAQDYPVGLFYSEKSTS